jgi:purine-binding chemotaxis protein CheW
MEARFLMQAFDPNKYMHLVLFSLGDRRFAVPRSCVLEVVALVLIDELPGATLPVLGCIRYRGKVVVVVDARSRLGLPPRGPSLDDHLLIAATPRRVIALLVDRVVAVHDALASEIGPAPVRLAQVAGVASLPSDLVLLQDLDAIFSLDEEAALDACLRRAGVDDR